MSVAIEDRTQQLAANLTAVRRRIAAACVAARRAPDEVTLVVVTKYFPAADVVALLGLGVHDIGENRDQEASAKVAELAAMAGQYARPTVHFIGQVQTNKAGSVASYADVVHSVDRSRLIEALSRGAVAHGRDLDVLLQVSLADGVPVAPVTAQSPATQVAPASAPGRGGADPDQIPALARAVADAPALRLRGLMAVAPRGADPAEAFGRLQELHAQLIERHPSATWLSAGMSGDLEAAIAHGATHVRVGSAILGARMP
jgi:PLP dependent protein